MAMMLGALYDALVKAQIPEAAARAAAEEVAGYDSRLASIEARVTLVQWMLGFALGLQLLVLGLLWQVLVRLPAGGGS